MVQKKQVELLAPAGNTEGFYGAIHAGADAVYLGGSRFGARAYADNFTAEELVSCIRYAHLWNRRVYLTVNTLVKESEFQELYEYLFPYYEAGLDGVIVQDIGVLVYIREHFPNMELHVSTQMTLTGEYGAKLLQEMGACRIVPARELSLQEIRQIKENTGLEIEAFIHGAMCYCYSGQCLFSSILGGRSGNRGRCAQPCRLPYKVKVGSDSTGECYPLSLKDMCTIEHIPELIDAGIDSFKIEGRMKKAEYTAGVTGIYRKYIDQYYHMSTSAGELNAVGQKTLSKFQIDAADRKALSGLYIRSEQQDGYYYKHNGKDMVTLDNPAYNGSEEEFLARIRHDYLEQRPKKKIAVFANFTTGERARVRLSLEELCVTAEGDVVQTADRQPIAKENIAKQLAKLGDTIFCAGSMEVMVSQDAFYSLRAINELRREAVSMLENALLERNGFPVCRNDVVRDVPEVRDCEDRYMDNLIVQHQTKDSHAGRICLSVRKKEQVAAILHILAEGDVKKAFENRLVSRIYLDGDLFITDRDTMVGQCRGLATYCELVIALPYVIRKKDYASIEKNIFCVLEQYQDIFSGIQIRSLDGMGMVRLMGYGGKLYTDTGFYIWNLKALQEWKNSIAGFCLPMELKGGEQRKLLNEKVSCEKIIYGRIPMMITANCVANSTFGCRKQTEGRTAELVDRYHKTFPVEINCTHCMNIIYNSVPLSLHGELSKWKERVDFRLDFTVENERETEEVMAYFLKITGSLSASSKSDFGYNVNTSSLKPPYNDYTTGHEKRGVE